MKRILFFISFLITSNSYSQVLDVITSDNSKISLKLLDSSAKSNLVRLFKGQQDNSLRKKWTARTFLLSNKSVIVEFYDRQAVLINSIDEFNKLAEVRFVKNTIEFLKKNISYKIELSFIEGEKLIKIENPKKLIQFKSEMKEYFDFEVYQLKSNQILFIDKSKNAKSATIYPDLKTLSSENTSIEEQYYNSDDDEYLMKKLASGDRLKDYEQVDQIIYPKYQEDLIKNHKLSLVETKVFVTSGFYGNLYKSENGYYILIDDFNQLNLPKTAKIGIGTLRIYNTLDEVRTAQKKYEMSKDKSVISEHFYKKISDRYGQKFSESVDSLIAELPSLLNFDVIQLGLDSMGIALIDEALKWNGTNYHLFDKWFPSVLAYYGKFYIQNKIIGKWETTFNEEYKIWIPGIVLHDKSLAFDVMDFYKDLYEGPIPLKWAGDFDGNVKSMRKFQ